MHVLNLQLQDPYLFAAGPSVNNRPALPTVEMVNLLIELHNMSELPF